MKFEPFKTKQIMENNEKLTQEKFAANNFVGKAPEIPTIVTNTTSTEKTIQSVGSIIEELVVKLKEDEKYVDVVAHLETALFKYNNLNK